MELLALALNVCIFVFEIIATIVRLVEADGYFGVKYYTQDSNLLMLIVSGAMIVCLLRKMINGKAIPRIVSVLKLSATVALLITFLVVIFVLAPTFGLPYGYRLLLFGGSMYYTHLICPLLSVATFLLVERHHYVKNDLWWAQIYTLVYAVIIMILNIARVIEGPYPFLMVYRQSVIESILWAVGILGGAYGLTWLLCKLRRQKC